jgi:hypothetical protein
MSIFVAASLCASAKRVIDMQIFPTALGVEQVHVAVIVDLYLESTRLEFETNYCLAFLTSVITYSLSTEECWDNILKQSTPASSKFCNDLPYLLFMINIQTYATFYSPCS